MLLYRKWFLKLKPFLIHPSFQPQTGFSVIIPARNEENNISACLQSVLRQNYPEHLFEVIVVDDHSTDQTAAIILQLQSQYSNLKLIKLADELEGEILNSYKKKAIEKAIAVSSKDWIITTDADCLITENWLQAYAAIIQEQQPLFVAAPVSFTDDKTIISIFQNIDFISMQGITAAAVSAGFHNMCNGANLAYKKEAFYQVNGFKGIDTIASGDDMLLMNKIKEKFPDRIAFLFSKQAIVTTDPMPDWKSFFNQRIRWASKADQYKDKNVFAVLVLVYFLNLALFIMPFLALYKPILFLWWLIFLISKALIELLFTKPVGEFFNKHFSGWLFILQPLHIVYIVVSGWLGKFGNYHWKGRNVK
jgi:cellulose synthase/poly-beta-1,6-N-acetylglucosamine synthase-like glycosyltransferase